MNDKHLTARARLILRELELRHPTFLHSWMAQYIAECLEMVEKDPTDLAARDRCAATIARLWQVYIEDRRRSTSSAIDVYRTRARLSDNALAALRAELSSKTRVVKGSSRESPVRLRQLIALEEHVLEVYGTSAALREERANQTAAEVPANHDADMMGLLAELRKETETEAQRIVIAVFPEFADLDLEDLDAVERAALVALRAIDRARRQRVGDSTSPGPDDDPSPKSPRSKKAVRKSTPTKGRKPKR